MTSAPIVLRDIPCHLDLPDLLRRLHIEDASEDAGELGRFVREAQSIGRPKAMYRQAFIDSKGDDHVIIEGVKLTSRVLRVNLDSVYRVFAYVATCGTELEEWSSRFHDDVHRFWLDAIRQAALGPALAAVGRHLEESHQPGPMATMNPGSLPDWPLPEQRGLFALLGDVEGSIGVSLTDSFLMVPTKSVSGLRFPAKHSYENCQLCPRDPCVGRSAPYDKDLFARRYQRKPAAVGSPGKG